MRTARTAAALTLLVALTMALAPSRQSSAARRGQRRRALERGDAEHGVRRHGPPHTVGRQPLRGDRPGRRLRRGDGDRGGYRPYAARRRLGPGASLDAAIAAAAHDVLRLLPRPPGRPRSTRRTRTRSPTSRMARRRTTGSGRSASRGRDIALRANDGRFAAVPEPPDGASPGSGDGPRRAVGHSLDRGGDPVPRALGRAVHAEGTDS